MCQATIRLNISGVIANRGDSIQYVHLSYKIITNPLYRITPSKLLASEVYDREKYLEMLLDSAEAGSCQYLNLIGHYLDLIRKSVAGGTNLTSGARKILRQQEQSCKELVPIFRIKMFLSKEIETSRRLYRQASIRRDKVVFT